MTLSTWFLFLWIEAAFSASPGPAVLMVISEALKNGLKKAHYAIAGILLGNFVYFMLSGIIIAFSIKVNDSYFIYIKNIGAIYLVYYAIKGIISSYNSKNNTISDDIKTKNKGFKVAFVMQLANPKTIIFFLAFLPQFINLQENIFNQIIILAITSAAIEYIILIIYAKISITTSKIVTKELNGNTIDIIGNVILLCAVVWWFMQ